MNKTWKVAAAFAVVFLLGGLIGAVCMLRYVRMHPGRSFSRPEQFGSQLMRRWIAADQLGLTQDQKDKIQPIIASTAEDLRRLRRDTFRTEELAIERMQDQISGVLTPEQRTKFSGMIELQRLKVKRFIQQQQQRALEQQIRKQETNPGERPAGN